MITANSSTNRHTESSNTPTPAAIDQSHSRNVIINGAITADDSRAR